MAKKDLDEQNPMGYVIKPSAINATERYVTLPEFTITGKKKGQYKSANDPTAIWDIPHAGLESLGKGMSYITPDWMQAVMPYLSPSQYVGMLQGKGLPGSETNDGFGSSKQDQYLNEMFDLGTTSLVLPKLNKYGYKVGKNIYNNTYNFIDRGFVPKSRILTQGPNTATRMVGLGDSGYSDALTSGIIRGNPYGRITSAKQFRKIYKPVLKQAGIPQKTIDAFASNNLTEQQFYLIDKTLKAKQASLNITPGKFTTNSGKFFLNDWFTYDYDLFEDMNYKDYLKEYRTKKAKNPDPNKVYTNDVRENWKGQPQATFALEDENIINSNFPGDYAVQIKNASNNTVPGNTVGPHLRQHVVPKYPFEYNHPDVSWYKRRKGILSGKEYMIKLSSRKIAKDVKKYKLKK